MSRFLISLLAAAAFGSAFAQSPSTPLEALEMDVLESGEKPEQALERMANKPRQPGSEHVPADAAALEERPTPAFGSAPLNTAEPRGILNGNADRAHDHKRERDRDHRRDKGGKDDRDDDHDDDRDDDDGKSGKGKGKRGD